MVVNLKTNPDDVGPIVDYMNQMLEAGQITAE